MCPEDALDRESSPATSAPPAPDDGDDAGRPLVADSLDAVSDSDSALGIHDDEFSTESLRSSIYNFQQENGRLYHSLSKEYILPSDEDENERLDIQDYHFLVTFGGRRCFAPGADTAKRVLDAGTGTGIWAIEFADGHPHARVLGVDLSPIQPDFVPPNCVFEIDDLEQEWTFSEPFDYIFSRMMVASFADWNTYTANAYQNLEPGGWIEMVDCLFPIDSDDDSLKEDHTILQWSKLLLEASEKLGRSLADGKDHKKRLIETGFTNVEEQLFKWPSNTWPKDKRHKEVGLWTLANIDGGLEGLSMALLTRGLGWTKEEVLVYLTQVRKDLRNPRIHAYWPIVVVYGQKPSS